MGAAAFGQVAGLFMTAVGNRADEVNAKYDARENTAIANQAAADALDRGNIEAAKARAEGTKVIARQTVAYAHSGVDPTSGSAADVMADTRMMSELDAQTAQNNAAREAWGFKKYGLKYGQQADRETARLRNQTMGSILSSAGKIGESYSSSK